MGIRDAATVALVDGVKFQSGGRDFCLRAAGQAQNPLSTSVFLVRADDEKDLLGRVREISEQLKDKPGRTHLVGMVAGSGSVDAGAAPQITVGKEQQRWKG